MAQEQVQEIPVFLITGFLDSGKTKFIREFALDDPSFVDGTPTLLLLCEDGEEEYDVEALAEKKVFVERLSQEIDLSEKILTYFLTRHSARRVLIEYNGMWQLNALYQGLPENWVIYQEMFFADASTFLTYNANMRQLVVDKLQSCEMAIFNRFTQEMDPMDYHKIVRGSSRRAQISYEYTDGRVVPDTIEDPLPFNIDDPVIEIKDEDYALWYRDITEEPRKYIGKIVELKGMAMTDKRFGPSLFAFGRQIMTCCVEDIQFCSLLTSCNPADLPESRSWYQAKVKCDFKFHKLYGRKGPVLSLVEIQKAEAPENEVATFF